MKLKAESISLSGAIFEAGGRLDVDGASVSLDRLVVDGRLTIIGSNGASVTSMQNADAGAVTLASIDLSDCIFWGAPNLDEISIESTVVLKSPPGWWRTRRHVLQMNFYGEMLTIAIRGLLNMLRVSSKLQQLLKLLACTFHFERVSKENRTNPGAADFYYGEMEMRRLDAATPIPENLCLRHIGSCQATDYASLDPSHY